MEGIFQRVSIRKFKERPVEKILNLPADQRAFAIFPFGYPAAAPTQQDRWDPSRIRWIG